VAEGRLDPVAGVASALRAQTVALAPVSDGCRIAWAQEAGAGGAGLQWTFLADRPPTPAFDVRGLEQPRFLGLQEVLLSPSPQAPLLLFRGQSLAGEEGLWRVTNLVGPSPRAERLTEIPSGFLAWDLVPWPGGHLLVWTTRIPSRPVELWAARLDPGGQVLEVRRLLGEIGGTRARIGPGPEGGLVVWDDGGRKIRGMLLDAAGQPVSGILDYWDAPEGWRLSGLRISRGPPFLVGWVEESSDPEAVTLKVGLVGADGRPAEGPPVTVARDPAVAELALARGAEEWLVAWWTLQGIRARRIAVGAAGDPEPVDPAPLEVAATYRSWSREAYPQLSVAEAPSGGFWIAGVRWTGPRPGGEAEGEIWGQRLLEEGTLAWPGGSPLVQTPTLADPLARAGPEAFFASTWSDTWRGSGFFVHLLDPGSLLPQASRFLLAASEPGDPRAESLGPSAVIQARLVRDPGTALEIVEADWAGNVRRRHRFGLAPEEIPGTLRMVKTAVGYLLAGSVAHDRILLAVVDSTLTAEHLELLGGPGDSRRHPALVAAGSGALLFWVGQDEGDGVTLRVTRVSAWGEPEDPAGPILHELDETPARLEATWGPGVGCLAWSAPGEIRYALFDALGELRTEPAGLTAAPGEEDELRVVWDGQVFAILWGDTTGRTLGLRVDPEGTPWEAVPWVAWDRPVAAAAAGSSRILLVDGEGALRLLAEPPSPPRPFALLSPAPGESLWTRRPLLRWEAAADPDYGDEVRYELRIRRQGSGELLRFAGLRRTHHLLETPLFRDRAYEWTVVASDLQGHEVQAAEGWRGFFVLGGAMAPDLESLRAEALGPAGPVRLEWRFRDGLHEGLWVERRSETDAAWERLGAVPPCSLCTFQDADPPRWGRVTYRLLETQEGGVLEELARTEVLVGSPTYELRLLPPLPNPARGRVALRYEAWGQQPVRLALMDASGRRLLTLRQDPGGPGSVTFVWSPPAGLASGLYLVVLEQGGRRAVRKLLVLGGAARER
jgi:hypothetical protein